MFTHKTTLTLGLILATLTTADAHADHQHNARYRYLDDLSFAAFIDARELRWEIHDDFVNSRDYDHLLEDADAIIAALQDVQQAIYRERSDAFIAQRVVITNQAIANLTSHLHGCDFASIRRGTYRPTYGGRGYHFSPETRHVGRVHVDAALNLIAKVEAALHALEREVCPVPRHGHSHRVEPHIDPVPVAPQPPILAPQSSRHNRGRSFEIPVGNGNSSFVFRIGF